jgi:hypothetical protein
VTAAAGVAAFEKIIGEKRDMSAHPIGREGRLRRLRDDGAREQQRDDRDENGFSCLH